MARGRKIWSPTGGKRVNIRATAQTLGIVASAAGTRNPCLRDDEGKAVTPAHIRPFPWRSLEATSHAEVSVLRDVKRWAATHVRLDRLAQAMSEFLDVEIGLYIPRARPLAMSAAIDRGVGVILARADLPDVARSALVEAEGALAANVVARALRRPPPALVNPAVDPAPGIAGAFAAVVAAAARRSHTGIVFRVIGAGPAAALEADLNKVDADLWAVSLTVLVGNESFAARIIVPRNAALGCPGAAWDAPALAALGTTPLAVP
ncbi:MAG: hypothetical protein M3O46_11520, partial [Myxococcota bacterium]|nr:hypothetical protein [Myxococcota bacterium]